MGRDKGVGGQSGAGLRNTLLFLMLTFLMRLILEVMNIVD